MKLEDQVVSLELTKKLKELGVKQESLFWWTSLDTIESTESLHLGYVNTVGTPVGSAFTVAELGEMLPAYLDLPHGRNDASLRMVKYTHGYAIYYQIGAAEPDYYHEAPTEADARAAMLIYLIENKLVDPISSNER